MAPVAPASRSAITLLAVPRTLDRVPALGDQLAQLGGGIGHLDLEVADVLDLARHAHEHRHRQEGAADRRVLDHDGDVEGVGQDVEEAEDPVQAETDGGAVVGRHHHDHGGAPVLRAPAPRGAHPGAAMGGRDDHGHASGDVAQDRAGQHLALLVGEDELFREVRQDAQPVRTRVDHEVHAAELPGHVEVAVLVEDRRHDGEDPAEAGRLRGNRAHQPPIRRC